jgi:hypothetical protein
MAACVQVFSNAVGSANIKVRKISGGGFSYKPILPIGKSTWSSGSWVFHKVAYLDNVFDACIELKQSNPRIPVNEPIDGTYKTDLFQAGNWSYDNPTVYIYVQ